MKECLSELAPLATPTKEASKFSMPNHDPNCKCEHLLLRYAFQQKWPGFPSVNYWHVMSEGRSKHSTLSIEGLKEWGLMK